MPSRRSWRESRPSLVWKRRLFVPRLGPSHHKGRSTVFLCAFVFVSSCLCLVFAPQFGNIWWSRPIFVDALSCLVCCIVLFVMCCHVVMCCGCLILAVLCCVVVVLWFYFDCFVVVLLGLVVVLSCDCLDLWFSWNCLILFCCLVLSPHSSCLALWPCCDFSVIVLYEVSEVDRRPRCFWGRPCQLRAVSPYSRTCVLCGLPQSIVWVWFEKRRTGSSKGSIRHLRGGVLLPKAFFSTTSPAANKPYKRLPPEIQSFTFSTTRKKYPALNFPKMGNFWLLLTMQEIWSWWKTSIPI